MLLRSKKKAGNSRRREHTGAVLAAILGAWGRGTLPCNIDQSLLITQ